MKVFGAWTAGLVAAVLCVAGAHGQELSGGWDARVIELERAILDRDCLDVIDEGQHLSIRRFTDADLEECDQGKIEEILESNQKFVDHLECKMLFEMKAAAEFRRTGAEGLENAFADAMNPIPDSATDLLRKVGKALDASSVAAAWIDSRGRNESADEFDLIAERLRLQAIQYQKIVNGQKKIWEAHMAADPNCPPLDDPGPPPTPEPIDEQEEGDRHEDPDDVPPPPASEPGQEDDASGEEAALDGRQVYRCAMDLDDPTLGRLVFCTEYDSERLGQQPTAEMIQMSASICREAEGAWQQLRCEAGWKQRCMTPKGVAHFYYKFTEGAPEAQCDRWRGTLESKQQ